MTRLGRVTVDGQTWLARLEGGYAVPVMPDHGLPGVDPLRMLLAQGLDVDSAPPVARESRIETARLLSPVSAPSKIVAIGLNYSDHALESGMEPPRAPVCFAKTPNSLLGPADDIRVDAGSTQQLDWEVELALVMGRRARRISQADAFDYVLGYTVCNDVSARDAQLADGQWVRGKSFDGFCPLGPWIVTGSEIEDPQSLGITSQVNGVTMQNAHTRDMLFGVAFVVEYLSRFMTLEPGDVISTGTPFGVGFSRNPPVYLADGDTVSCEIERIGSLRNTVRIG